MIKININLRETKQPLLKFYGIRILIFIICLAIFYFILRDFTLSYIISLFLAVIFIRLDSRVFIVLALLFLILCPILLSMKKDALTETIAVNAFFMLVIGVAIEILELVWERLPEKLKTFLGKICIPILKIRKKIHSFANQSKTL